MYIYQEGMRIKSSIADKITANKRLKAFLNNNDETAINTTFRTDQTRTIFFLG